MKDKPWVVMRVLDRANRANKAPAMAYAVVPDIEAAFRAVRRFDVTEVDDPIEWRDEEDDQWLGYVIVVTAKGYRRTLRWVLERPTG